MTEDYLDKLLADPPDQFYVVFKRSERPLLVNNEDETYLLACLDKQTAEFLGSRYLGDKFGYVTCMDLSSATSLVQTLENRVSALVFVKETGALSIFYVR